ncbi:rab11 family-interacting protein 3 isoform X2 [Phyllopteryx taeniolatus]|uniref:rab11 family-interacting protein 3 isoform X2 n=1 Tax=Phyllopteryx taeniolatus TaxID=161469 RepID=UPI002AD5279A|nr:rab11 family-interacting protein 3 isoform X2 [Phyllopteryx taeniolatus]
MEPTVVSSPLGHAQWESEQAFPLGFLTLDSDNGGVLCQNNSGQTGLHFGDPNLTSQRSEMDKGYQDAPVELDKLLYISDYPCGDLFFDERHSTASETSPQSERNKEPDETSDFMLSWLFSPNLTDVVGKNFAFDEASLGGNNALNGQSELIINSHATILSSQQKWNSESNPADSLISVDLLSDDQAFVASEPSGVSHGVSAGLVDLAQEEQSRATSSCETGDKGLFPDQVTTLPVNSSLTPLGLPESSLPLYHSSTPLAWPQGAFLDLESPDLDSGLTAHPDHPTGPPADDATIHGELSCGSFSVESTSKDLMEGKICSVAEHQASASMVLDLCSATDGVRCEETWNWKVQEGVHDGTASDAMTEQREEGQSPSVNHHQDFNVLELSSCTEETKWTSEQSVETVSHSKMVGDDSLPMVSALNTREEDASPLKTVFDALDQDGDGFVRIEEFMEFAAAYGADQVKDLTKFLDPSGLGVISFEDFHRGISAISNGGPEPQLYSANYSPGDGAVGCPEEYDEQNEVTDSAYLGSESTYSECETFTDEDTGALVPPEMHEDVDTDSGIEAALHDPEEAINRFSLNSALHNPSLMTVIGGEEEHFEDFGESNTSELLLESGEEGTDGMVDCPLAQMPQQIDVSSLLSPSAPVPLPDCFQSFLKEEALDFFCSQCHKQISRLEDLSTRLNFLEMTSAGKRLSSKKVARHLLQNSSLTLDTVSDLTRDILELADNDITDKMLLLERRVAELEKESETSGEQHARLRQENLQLVHRANALEEQLKEQELLADEQLQHEIRRHKEALSKLERERGLELENLQSRLQQLDEENSELRSCVPCLRANIERLEEEKLKLEDEVDLMSDKWQDEMESRQKMADKLSHEQHQNQKEKESTQELIEDLRKQLEHLQLYRLEAEAKRGRSPSAGLQEYQTRTREAELDQEIKRLKQDNRSLKEQNDELNGQIINLSIQGAKSLMSASFSDSLAAEINSVSRSELMEAVHKQEEINYRLQDYIDKIIVAIMESNPSMLEVK